MSASFTERLRAPGARMHVINGANVGADLGSQACTCGIGKSGVCGTCVAFAGIFTAVTDRRERSGAAQAERDRRALRQLDHELRALNHPQLWDWETSR